MRGMQVTVSRTQSVEEFLAHAGDFLAAREAEHNLLFGICSTIRTSPEAFGMPPRFAVATGADGKVRAAALQTPPWNLVLSTSDDDAAVDAIADALAREPLPGVTAPKEVAARFVARWRTVARAKAILDTEERIFRIARVIPPPRPARGTWRIVEQRDRDVVARWVAAFTEEATPGAPPLDDPEGVADRWVAQRGRIGYVWEDEGRVVSLVGAGGETPNGIRIGPVYTPPEHRGHGYASSLTAAATQDQLDRGRRFVFLFTDLANPTSNKIYQSIGYEPVCDVDMYRFADA